MSGRYEKLGYVALNVTDVSRARRFYEAELGLEYVGEGESGEAFFRCSTDHHNVILYPATTPGLKRIGWEMENADELAKLVETLRAAGHSVTEVASDERRALHQGPSYRYVEAATGATFEFYSLMYQFSTEFRSTTAKIQRLGHIVLKTPRAAEAVEFLTKFLNFRISDAIGERAIFLRCFPNPFHHALAIIEAKDTSLHHVNFMVTEIDDIGRGMVRFKNRQVPVVHGPGRHPPSGSIFLYFLDPDGLTIEYSFGMEEFPESGARKHRVLEFSRESFDYWGCDIDPRKASVGAIEGPADQRQKG